MNEYHKRVLEGRKKFLKLQQQQEKELLKIYSEAGQKVSFQLAKSKNGTLNQRHLSNLNASIKKYVKELNIKLNKSIEEGTKNSADIAAETQLGFFSTLGLSDKVNTGIGFMYVNLSSDIVKTLINGQYYEDGRSLSQRIWRLTAKNAKDIDTLIKVNLAKGANAGELAKELSVYIDPTNRMTTRTRVPGINKSIAYQAQRLARTSLSNASSETFIQGTKRNPFCTGLKWNLSSSHYERQIKRWGPDVCDDRAGKVYEPNEYPIAHCNCLCYPTQEVDPDKARKELIDWVNGANNKKLDQWVKDYGETLGLKPEEISEIIDTNTTKNGIIKANKTISGHYSLPSSYIPNGVIDLVNAHGKTQRSFYDEESMLKLQIDSTDHGFPKKHPYGTNGEHAHVYTWKDGVLVSKETREITDEERKQNQDIL